jgi:hypothetical protein
MGNKISGKIESWMKRTELYLTMSDEETKVTAIIVRNLNVPVKALFILLDFRLPLRNKYNFRFFGLLGSV